MITRFSVTPFSFLTQPVRIAWVQNPRPWKSFRAAILPLAIRARSFCTPARPSRLRTRRWRELCPAQAPVSN